MNRYDQAHQYVAIAKVMINAIPLRGRKKSVIIYLSGFL